MGASIGEADQTSRFIAEGKWELGWYGEEDNSQYQKMLLKLKEMKAGDSIVIKASYTQKNGLPYENPDGKTSSVMKLKAKGTITKNLHDGHTVNVNWDKDFEPKTWYFFTGRETIWDVSASPSESAKKLIDFVERDVPQNFQWFLSQPEWSKYGRVSQENSPTADDVEAFKKYLDKFIEVVKNSEGNIGTDKNGEKIHNYVVGGTTEGDTLPSGLKLGKKYAGVGNRLYRFPYVNNRNWTNLYFDWKPEHFGEPTLFVSVPNKEAKYFKHPLDNKFNVTWGSQANFIFGYEASSPVRAVDYEGLLKAMMKLTMATTFDDSHKGGAEVKEYQNSYTNLLLSAKNIIFRGAPGTGKTHLAQEIAADLVTAGRTNDIEELTPDEMKQIGFVQFHPSYDYTDFVEGLRPSNYEKGLGFELESGTFKLFCERANEKISQKDDKSIEDIWNEFIESIDDQTVKINNYKFEANSRGNITYFVPGGSTASLTLDNVRWYLQHDKWGEKNYHSTYKTPIFEKYIKPQIKDMTLVDNTKPYIFIIDEINRGEISKIFGELFFSIDPGYRGKKGGILTQYSNLHENPDEKFYIPENVYIIGTMNDIDRSVDTFDFAMRRRFTFLEVTAEESAQNMNLSKSVYEQMKRINDSIVNKGGLTSDYQIGASYFVDLKEPETDAANAPLWHYKICPLLKDYFRGEHRAEDKLSQIKKDYFNEEG